MKITIELDHNDIVGAKDADFEAFFTVLQAFTKSIKISKLAPKIFDEVHAEKNVLEKTELTAEKISEKKSVEPTIDRAEIEMEIKKIALEGKEKNISAKIKELIQGYGFEKLSEVPDEKISELLGKVKAL